jgi:hypothetical protein
VLGVLTTKGLVLLAFPWQDAHCRLVQVVSRQGRRREGEEEQQREKEKGERKGGSEEINGEGRHL